MKKLTVREWTAVKEVLNAYIGPGLVDKAVNAVADAIDIAEGYPVPKDDKYKEAKSNVESKISELNEAIKICDNLGIILEIDRLQHHPVAGTFNETFVLQSASVKL